MTTPTIDRAQAVKLIGDLSRASVRSYRAVNEPTRLSSGKACLDEVRAARRLFEAMTGEAPTQTELEEALSL